MTSELFPGEEPDEAGNKQSVEAILRANGFVQDRGGKGRRARPPFGWRLGGTGPLLTTGEAIAMVRGRDKGNT